jgi:WD40 repeat protein/tRNA A-37 threonylcarbamoyl transferase component Bud32
MTEETIFAAALEKRSPAERAAYLDEACGGNAALREQVEALLKADAVDGNFLAVPVVAQVAEASRPAGEVTEAITSSLSADPSGGSTGEQPRGSAREESLDFLARSQKPGSLGRLDHYEILEVVGHGGMGVVLKAFDEKLHRVAAIKVLAPQMAANGTARKRFVREAQAAAAVAHDHIVAIHAVEEAGAVPYLVMHYVAGISLEDRIKQGGPLELKEILRIGIQTAAGLAAAHAQGLVHRDVKPANILLENGVQRVKITDFGLARAVDDASLTQSGVIAGTPMYMSPEQARGEAVDHRSDLFSLGSVLYTLCTGHPPFRASGTMAVLKRVCEDTPRPIREINADIPDWLAAIITKLHAKNPAERIQSAAEVAELLSQHLAHLQQPQLAPRPATVELKRPARPRRWQPIALAAGILLAVGAAAVPAYYWLTRPTPLPPPPGDGDPLFAPAPVRTPEELAKLPSPFDGRERDDIPRRLLAMAGSGDPDQAAPELVAVIGDAGRFKFTARPGWGLSPDGSVLVASVGNDVHVLDARTGDLRTILRGQSAAGFFYDNKRIMNYNDPIWRVLDIETGQVSQVMPRGAIPGSPMAVTPDGERVVASARDGTVLVWDKDFKQDPLVLRGPAPGVHGFAFSPDGKWIVQRGDDGIVRVRSTEKEEPVHLLKRFPQRVLGLEFSPDGKLLAAGTNNEFTIFDATTFQEVPQGTVKESGGFLAFAADSKSIWSAKHDHNPNELYTVARIDVATGTKSPPISLKARGGWGFYALSPDRKTLYAHSTNDSFIGVYDLETGTEKFPPQGHDGPVLCVAVSPDGKLVASGGVDRAIKLWNLAEWKKGDALPPVRTLPAMHTDVIRSLTFSPNGKLLASASNDQTVVIWDVERGEEFRTIPGTGRDVFRVAFSPDGRLVAGGGDDGRVLLWNLAENKEGVLVCRHSASVRAVAFSPDGKWLASAGVHRGPNVLVTEIATRRVVHRLSVPNTVFSNVAFSADGKTLAAVCDFPDGALHLWNVADWKETRLPGHARDVHGLAFSPIAPLLATRAADGTVRFWDQSTDKVRDLSIPVGPAGGDVNTVFTPDGRYLVTGNTSGAIVVLKVPPPPVAYVPGPPVKLPDPLKLAKRPSAADKLDRKEIPKGLLATFATRKIDVPPELVAIFDHGVEPGDRRILTIAFSPDGKLLASGCIDGSIKLWDMAGGNLVRTLPAQKEDVRSLAFSPDGMLLAAGYAGGANPKIKLWDAATGEEVRSIPCIDQNPRQLAFAPDGKTLASSSNEGNARIWDVSTGKLLRTFSAGSPLWAITFSLDGKILTAGGERAIRFWDVSTGWEIRRLEGHDAMVRGLAFHPDGQSLASTCQLPDSDVRVWDLAAGTAPRRLPGHQGHLLACQWRADGKLIASCATDGTVRLWDPSSTPPRCKEIKLFPSSDLHDVAISPEGRYLATGNPDGTIYILKLAEPGEVFEVPPAHIELQPKTSWQAHDRFLTDVLWSEGGVISASKDGFVKIWRAEPPKGPGDAPTPLQTIAAQEDGVRTLARSADGKTLATAGFDGIIRLWDAKGNQLHELPGHKGGTSALLFAARETQLVSGGADGMVRFWRAEPRKGPGEADSLVREFGVSTAAITHLSLSPDGKAIAVSASDMTARLYDVATGKQAAAFADCTHACFGPVDGPLAVVTRHGTIELRDPVAGTVRARLRGDTEAPVDISFTANGKRLATCGKDGTLRVWDASSGHLLAVLRGAVGRPCCVGLSADGATAAAGAEDGKLLLWDLSGPRNRPAQGSATPE